MATQRTRRYRRRVNWLSRLVSDITVAETDKEWNKLWKQAGVALRGLRIPRERAGKILEARNTGGLAKIVTELY